MTKKDKFKDRITWVCMACGQKHGRHKVGLATWHYGTCDICGGDKLPVTEPLDFGGVERINPKKVKK